MSPTKVDRASRIIEDTGFAAGILLGLFLAVVEALGILKHFPLVGMLVFAGLVLPKTLGRATAGKIWIALASRIGGRGLAKPQPGSTTTP